MAPPNIYDKIDLWISIPMMTGMIIFSMYWFIFLMKHSTFRSVQFMLFLCVIQNFNSLWLACLYYTSETNFHKEHQNGQWLMYSVSIFLFYFLSNLIYWLFGFKYWVISIEVPK